jgi:chromosome segregation ATPase
MTSDERDSIEDALREELARLKAEVHRLKWAEHEGLARVAELEDMNDTIDADMDTLRSAVREYLPLYAYDDGTGEEASELECIEYAGDEIKRLKARVAELEREIAYLRGTNRCAVCGWTLAEDREHGCVRGDCSMRPRPEYLYDPERAAKEREE